MTQIQVSDRRTKSDFKNENCKKDDEKQKQMEQQNFLHKIPNNENKKLQSLTPNTESKEEKRATLGKETNAEEWSYEQNLITNIKSKVENQ